MASWSVTNYYVQTMKRNEYWETDEISEEKLSEDKYFLFNNHFKLWLDRFLKHAYANIGLRRDWSKSVYKVT